MASGKSSVVATTIFATNAVYSSERFPFVYLFISATFAWQRSLMSEELEASYGSDKPLSFRNN